MNRTICCTVLLLFAFGILAQAQVTSEARPITVPFHKPPPAFIQFVPNEMVLKVNAQVADFSSLNESNASATTCDELNHLNVKFKVKSFAREFPDPGVTTLASTARLDLSQYYVVKFGDEFELEEVMEAYAGVACVISAQPIGVHPVYERFPNDPFFSDQWNFYDAQDNDVDATDAWEYETGDATVVLGVLDTGLQYNSGDLGGSSPYINGNVWINWAEYNGSPGIDDDGNGYTDDWIGWDFVNNVYPVWPGEDGTTPDNEPTDFNGHGTHVAGIMGAITNNGYAVAGLAGGWNENPGDPANGVKLMALRIGWSGSYQGQEVGYVRMDFAAQAIYYATNKGATAVNCSWGSSNTGGLGAAVDYAVANGVVVVAAAGNDGDSNPDYLGTREDVINVCATNSNDVKPWWSDYGAWVDVAAPGDNIRSTYSYHYNPNYVAFLSGTSQAAPHVTGEAGMLKSHCDTLSGDQITDLIVTYVDDIDDLNPGYAGLLGSGRINVFKAIDAVYAPDVTVIQPNGGEVLYIGQIYTIIWDATDNVGIAQTRIEYSVDGGESWMHIVDLDGNPGEYDWTVTGPPSSTCRMKVICWDDVGREGWDMSDDDFCPPYKAASRTFAIAGPGVLPGIFALHQNSPNPFNPSTAIKFNLPQTCHVRFDIYNVAGQLVETLIDGEMESGEHQVIWNGTNSAGETAAAGIYLYRLKAGDYMQTRKMVMIK